VIQAYTIGVSMFLETNIGSALPGVIKAFEMLNAIAKEAQTNTAALGSALRGIGRAEPGIRALAMSMERLHSAQQRAADSAAKLNGAVTNIPSGGAGGAVAAATAAVAAATRSGGGGGGAGASGGALTVIPQGGGGAVALNGIQLNPNFNQGTPRPSSGELMQAGIGFGLVGAALTEFVKNAIEARAEIDHLQSGLRTMGFTAEQSNEALNQAIRLQQEVPGMSVGGGLHMIQDVMSLLQKPGDALNPAALTEMAKTAIVLQSAGKGDAMANLFKAIQAGELRGALNGPDGELSQEGLQKFLRNVDVTTVQTGGRVGPAEILQFLKSSNASGAMLTDSALFADSIMPILSMGAAKAGTALQGISMQMASGKMSEATANMLAEGGLLHLPEGKTVKDYKTGIGQFRFPQEVLPDAGMAQQRPYDFIEKTLLPFIDKYDAAHGGLATDPAALMAQRMATAQQLSSRIPGGAMIGDVVRNYMLIERDRAAIAGGSSRDAYDERSQNDPQVKFQALTAAMNAMMVSLGGPIMDSAIKGIQQITTVFNAISDWAKAHPETAGDIMKTVASLGALSLAVAGASAAFFFAGPMIKTLQWLAGAQAAAAAGNLTAVGAAIASVAGIAASFAIAYGVGKVVQSGFDYLGGKAEDALYGANNPHVAAARAQRAAVENFSMFDRSTWADPNGSWWNMSPRMPGAPAAPTGPVPVVVTNGRDLANGVAGHIANQVSRAPSGQTGFDPRMTPSPTGATP
jgi:hypothetical protein